ncbi:MAG: hypothetical protein ABII74_08995 [Elusimicrobiota bacterium]
MKHKKIISSLLLICLIFSSSGQNYLAAFQKDENNRQLRPPPQTISLGDQPEVKSVKPVTDKYQKLLLIGLIVSFFVLTRTAGSAAAVATTTVLVSPIIQWLAAGFILLILINNLLIFLVDKKKSHSESYWWLIPIKISWSWLAGFAFFSWLNADKYGWNTSMLLIITLYGMVLLHEVAHVLVGNGIKHEKLFNEIQIIFFGTIGSIDEKKQIDAKTEFFFTIAGPLTSLILFFMFTSIGTQIDNQILVILGIFNFFVLLINCFPIYPLDGGRAIKAYWRITANAKNTSSDVADYWATEKALKLGKNIRKILLVLGIVCYYLAPQAIVTIIVLLYFPVLVSWLLSKIEKNDLRKKMENLGVNGLLEYRNLQNYPQKQRSSFSL